MNRLWQDGYFLLPSVVLDAQQGDEIVREEQFGPILPIVVCDSEEQAIAYANDTEYGLCSSVWSSEPEHALEVASRIEAGVTFVNSATVLRRRHPGDPDGWLEEERHRLGGVALRHRRVPAVPQRRRPRAAGTRDA